MELQVWIPVETKSTRERHKKSCLDRRVRWLHSRGEGGGGTRSVDAGQRSTDLEGGARKREVEEEKGETEHRYGGGVRVARWKRRERPSSGVADLFYLNVPW
jgi:hypothetical protein